MMGRSQEDSRSGSGINNERAEVELFSQKGEMKGREQPGWWVLSPRCGLGLWWVISWCWVDASCTDPGEMGKAACVSLLVHLCVVSGRETSCIESLGHSLSIRPVQQSSLSSLCCQQQAQAHLSWLCHPSLPCSCCWALGCSGAPAAAGRARTSCAAPCQ